MKTRIIPLIISVLFIIIFILFYQGLRNSNIYVPKANINKEIPSFTAKLFESSKEVSSLEIFKDNQFYLMNIWSSWCIPCRDEHILLTDLSDEKNLNLVGLNYKDNIENAKSFLNDLGNPYDIIFLDPKGIIAIDWGAYGVPETYLIKKNMIIKKMVGPLNIDLVKEIKEIIK